MNEESSTKTNNICSMNRRITENNEHADTPSLRSSWGQSTLTSSEIALFVFVFVFVFDFARLPYCWSWRSVNSNSIGRISRPIETFLNENLHSLFSSSSSSSLVVFLIQKRLLSTDSSSAALHLARFLWLRFDRHPVMLFFSSIPSLC